MPAWARRNDTTTSPSDTAAFEPPGACAAATAPPTMRSSPFFVFFEGNLSGQKRVAKPLETLDQPRFDKEPVEPARFLAGGATIERAVTALEDLLLLGKGWIEWDTRGFLHEQRQIGRVERIQRG